MANKLDDLLSKLDSIVADSIRNNLYNDTNPYNGGVSKLAKLETFQQSNVTHQSLESRPRPALQSRPAAQDLTQYSRDLKLEPSNMPDLAAYDKDLIVKLPSTGPNKEAQAKALQVARPAASNLADAKRPSPNSLFRPASPQQLKDYNAGNAYGPNSPYNTKVSKLADAKPEEGNIRTSQNNYSDKVPFAPIAASSPLSAGDFDVFAIAHWARAIGQEFGALPRPGTAERSAGALTKGITFAASQFLLASLNPGDIQVGGALNRIYNPLHLGLSAVPGARAFAASSPNAAAAISGDGNVYERNTLANPERLLLMRQGLYQRTPGPSDVLKGTIPTPGFLGDIAPDALSRPVPLPLSIQAQVDQEGPLAGVAVSLPIHRNIYTPNKPYSAGAAAPLEQLIKQSTPSQAERLSGFIVDKPNPQLSALFEPSFPGAVRYSWKAKARFPVKSSPYPFGVNPASYPDNVDVEFNGHESLDGTVSETDNPVADDENYMPFYFQDLRDNPPKLMYFRAFLHEGLQENFSPNWNTENFYGRVDEVPTYSNTVRTISFVFDIVAWSPKDLMPMYVKLHKLQSFAYPSFDTQGYINSGPVIRMRIGDLICAQAQGRAKKGLPGYINTLSFAYDEVWNITEDFKVPRKVSVTMGFTVIHEGNPGLYPFSSIQSIPGQAVTSVPLAPQGLNFGGLSALDQTTNQANVLTGYIRGLKNTIDKLNFT